MNRKLHVLCGSVDTTICQLYGRTIHISFWNPDERKWGRDF